MRPRIFDYKTDSQGLLDSVEEVKWDDIPVDLQTDIIVQGYMETQVATLKKSIDDRLSGLPN